MCDENDDWPVPASTYLLQPEPAPLGLPDDELARAIKIKWPPKQHHVDYLAEIYCRFSRMPIDDAIKCVSAGYSSPAHAMTEGIVKQGRSLKSKSARCAGEPIARSEPRHVDPTGAERLKERYGTIEI